MVSSKLDIFTNSYVCQTRKATRDLNPVYHKAISFLAYLSKIYERLIFKYLSPHIFAINILSASQFGFRAKHSTVHEIHRIVDVISAYLKKKNVTVQLFSWTYSRPSTEYDTMAYYLHFGHFYSHHLFF
jgi:hypothetical protein